MSSVLSRGFAAEKPYQPIVMFSRVRISLNPGSGNRIALESAMGIKVPPG
jgi:hypothetical protein